MYIGVHLPALAEVNDGAYVITLDHIILVYDIIV